MAKGYNRYNFLLRVKAVCETYQHHNALGVTAVFIFDNYIEPQFFISRTTFFAYLNINYKKELAELEAKFKKEKTV